MDKFSALWLSHSSISSFKVCPRAYYLANVYRDPRNNHKISLISPRLALGSAIHEVLESLSHLAVEIRFKESLLDRYELAWQKVSGSLGGFADVDTENHYKNRGAEMLRRVMAHPGPLTQKAVRLKADLPYYWLSEPDNIILCGRLDWIEYIESSDSVHILDFKTGVGEEKVDSLQLPIYYLLAHNCQSRPITKASYWYIARDDVPIEKKLPDLETSASTVLKIGKEIKLARSLNRFKCPGGSTGCRECTPYEKIISGEAVFVGQNRYGADVYSLTPSASMPESEIL